MTFDEWCKKTSHSRSMLAQAFGVSENYISMLRTSRASPGSRLMVQIYKASDGDVGIDDWNFDNGQS